MPVFKSSLRAGLRTALALLVLSSLPARAERDTVSVFFFGNSLVNYLPEDGSDPDLSAVPYWLARMAAADGRGFTSDGEWGFLRNFAEMPPTPNWSFDGVEGAWGDNQRTFGEVGYDTVVITPSNFVQHQPPETAYENNPSEGSPLSATLSVIDGVSEETKDLRYLIYEGWPDMGGFGRFPPAQGTLAEYHDYTRGDYRDWFSSYLAAIDAARPEARIRMIPVASVLADWLTGPLSDIPVEAIYVDDAPHGTSTLYFLAAMVTYAELFESAPPADFQPPDAIHETVREMYPQLAASLATNAEAPGEPGTRTAEAPEQPQTAPGGTGGARETARTAPEPDAEDRAATAPESGEAPTGDSPARKKAAAVPGFVAEAESPTPRGLDRPALAMGLNGIADWSTQHPFIDLMKTARPWVGHLRGERWGGFPAERLEAEGHLDAEGWPLRIPEDVTKLETFVLTGMPEEATSLAGRYVLSWDGEGDLRVGALADNTRYSYSKREVRFDYTPGEGTVSISFTRTDPDDPIRNITLVRESHEQLHAAGAIFNPDWLARVEDLRMVRFMDWMFTNGSELETWDQRPRVGDYSYVRRGVPLPVMLRLANRIGVNPWFTLPHLADDAYVRAFAEEVKAGLDPRLTVHAEYSNELWNFVFPQAQWANRQAQDRWGTDQNGAWMQFAGLRAAEVAGIWSDVFGEEADDRLVNVVSVHTGWMGLEEVQLEAPLAEDVRPADAFDAYAVAAYFGHELGTPEMLDSVTGWIEASRLVAVSRADEKGLEGEARAEFLEREEIAMAADMAAGVLAKGSLSELTGELLPYHAKTSDRYGLDLEMYEGGTHVVGLEAVLEEQAVTDFFTRFNYSPQMTDLYGTLLAAWDELGDGPFNAFVDVAIPAKWGSWGALRHLDDANPRWDRLMEANLSGRAGPASPAFLQGVTLTAENSEGARLEGTTEEDILLGGPGDDVLVSFGGADLLHGGDGTDTVLLAGARDDYRFEGLATGATEARKGNMVIRLTKVETVAFEADPERSIALDDLVSG